MKLPFKKDKRPSNMLKLYDPDSPAIIEVQRLFKTLYGKGGASSGLRSLMITSAMPDEGKSVLVGLLGIVAAHGNQRTLIIDGDLRRPVQHHQFPVPSAPGLSDYLLQESDFDQVIQDTGLENLSLIPCGNRVSSPGGLLHANTVTMKGLLDQCQVHFDVVIVDIPPVVPVNDPEVVGSMVDGVTLVIKSGKTYRELIERALELLGEANCNMLGFVLNNMNRTLPYYYEHRYYRYGYGYGPSKVWSEK
jgi:capsular exopolysaccharide synthesis family protein